MSDFLILDDEKKVNNSEKQTIKSSVSIFDTINNILLSFQKVSAKSKVVFYRLLATMVNSGMPLIKSMMVLEKQEKNPIFKKIIFDIQIQLWEWKNLSDCLDMHPGNFSESEIGIVKSWEKTGQLNVALLDLADQIEKVNSVNGKIKGAMMYPAFIVIVVIGVVWVLMTKIVPGLLEIFPDKDKLPEITQLLINISDFFVGYWFVVILVVLVIVVLIWFWRRTDNGKYIYDGLILKIPIFGWIYKKMLLSKFSRIFSSLMGSWVSIIETLRITATAVGNEVYKQRIILLSEDVGKWIKIWESLDGDPLFPEMMVQMIQVWEQTAKLDKTIIKIAEFYDEEIDNTVKILNKLLEPIIIVVLAVIVWFIALAIMQPILSISDTIWV